MISYRDALALVLKAGGERTLAVETVGIADMAGRICAEDITAPIANQPFDNSAMDGFAMQAADLAAATNDNPAVLEMIGHIAAGDQGHYAAPERSQCYEIMTGAQVPQGCDIVVPVENIEKDGRKILCRVAYAKGGNIRTIGEDFKKGDPVLGKGQILNAGHVLTLATLGVGRVKVLKRPHVFLISTGGEVVDDLDAPLGAGQIYNSTRPYLQANLLQGGMDVSPGGTVPDDPALFEKIVAGAVEQNADLIVSTGAVSAGVHDFVPSTLRNMGAEILFHKVAIRPGKPVMLARLPNGTFYMGLPGNPVSSAACARFFIWPLIRAMRGLPPEMPIRAILKKPWQRKGGEHLRFFARLTTQIDRNALCEAVIPDRQQSFMVRPFVHTNAWGVIEEGRAVLAAGESVAVYPD